MRWASADLISSDKFKDREEFREFQTLLQFSFVSWFSVWARFLRNHRRWGATKRYTKRRVFRLWFYQLEEITVQNSEWLSIGILRLRSSCFSRQKKKNREKGNSSCFAIHPHLSSIRGPKNDKGTRALKWPALTNLICPQSVRCVCVSVSFGLGWPQRPLLLCCWFNQRAWRTLSIPLRASKRDQKFEFPFEPGISLVDSSCPEHNSNFYIPYFPFLESRILVIIDSKSQKNLPVPRVGLSGERPKWHSHVNRKPAYKGGKGHTFSFAYW